MRRSDIIVRNTLVLYFRMLIVLVINLFIVRIVLEAFGEIEYGVYNVIAGVISMFTFLNTVIMTSTQRFYSIALGERDNIKLNIIYSLTIKACVLISLLVIIVSETFGIYLLNNALRIPHNLNFSANILFQITIINFVLSVFQIPFGACIIAHEDIGKFAIISTLETVLKLISALLLLKVYNDRLILYGVFLAFTTLIVLLLYIWISKKDYSECKYVNTKDNSLLKEIISFSGWSSLGSIAGMGIHYVNTIIINIFFGPLINTVFAISFQVSSALNSFCGSIVTAIRPPMIKLYVEKEYFKLNELFFLSNKGIFYCLLVICIPIMIETHTILDLWLNYSNEQTVIFIRLIILYSLILVLNNPISIIIQATGYVKEYFLPVETITLLCPILTYICFKLGSKPEYVIYSMIFCVFISHIVRIIIIRKYYDKIIIRPYCIFLFKSLIISLITFSICLGISHFIIENFIRLVAVIISSIFITLGFGYCFALNKMERNYVSSIIRRLLK